MEISQIKILLETLRDYFVARTDVAFAFLFGSAVGGRVRKEGDIDIAIYFFNEKDVEWEEFTKTYKGENKIALDLERMLKKEVDLIVLNRARAIIADEIIRKGRPILIKDRGIFLDYLCIISDEAEQSRNWIEKAYQERHLVPNR